MSASGKIVFSVHIRNTTRYYDGHQHVIGIRNILLSIAFWSACIFRVDANHVVDASDMVHVRHGLQATVTSLADTPLM